MEIMIKRTDQLMTLDGVRVQLWEGVTNGGQKCAVFVHRIVVDGDNADEAAFESALIPMPPPQDGPDFTRIL